MYYLLSERCILIGQILDHHGRNDQSSSGFTRYYIQETHVPKIVDCQHVSEVLIGSAIEFNLQILRATA